MHTVFDGGRDGRPLATGIYQDKKLTIYQLYAGGTNRSIYDIKQDLLIIKDIIRHNDVILNDFKQHLVGFDLEHCFTTKVWDLCFDPINQKHIDQIKSLLLSNLAKTIKTQAMPWHELRADAGAVYAYLQRKGIKLGYETVYPVWHTDTFSGRARTTGFNVQGLGSEDYLGDGVNDIFINFDWNAADLRMASLLSGDVKLQDSFAVGDPYAYIAADMDIPRPIIKTGMLAALNSFDVANPIFAHFGILRQWILSCIATLKRDGCLLSILGRRFTIEGDRTDRSVFNATIQGSVAHAMQAVLRGVYSIYPTNILFENHDSLVMMCSKSMVRSIIDDVSMIMVRPFRNILNSNPVFPITISVGSKYKKWRKYLKIGLDEKRHLIKNEVNEVNEVNNEDDNEA